MTEPLTKADYDYILASLKYARYAHENTHYATELLKHHQLSYLDHIEEKLRALRNDLENKATGPNRPAELF